MNSSPLKSIDNFDAAKLSSLRAGGVLKRVYFPSSLSHLNALAQLMKLEGKDFEIIGKLTNTLVLSGGFKGTAVSCENLQGITVSDNEVYAGAGESIAAVAYEAKTHELSGFEKLSGIPGTVGGAVCMNAGSFGAEISKILKKAYVFDLESLCTKELSPKDLNMRYRSTSLMDGRKLVVGACFELEKADRYHIENISRACIVQRKENQPSGPSLGSVFKKVNNISAGILIEGVKLKGESFGGMKISEKHANFIVNAGGGTPEEYLTLMELAEKRVYESYGIRLEREVRIIGQRN